MLLVNPSHALDPAPIIDENRDSARAAWELPRELGFDEETSRDLAARPMMENPLDHPPRQVGNLLMQIHGQILILSIPAELHFRPRLVLSVGTVDPVPRSL